MRPRDIGTAAETAVVRYLRENGFPGAERRAMRGGNDAGDITGTPLVAWEVKAGQAAKNASDGQAAEWLAETERERVNARADIGVLVLARAGIGPANAGLWWAVLTGASMYQLDGYEYWPAEATVRVHLWAVTRRLRVAGYGTPLDGDGAA